GSTASGRVGFPTRRHLHRRDAHGRHAQCDAAVARDLLGGMVAAHAVRKSWAVGGPTRALPRPHRHARLLLPATDPLAGEGVAEEDKLATDARLARKGEQTRGSLAETQRRERHSSDSSA